jgi:hypothetical protein
MLCRGSIAAIALATALALAIAGAQALDEPKYPDWKGQWIRPGGGGGWDPTKPSGRGQQAPLTDEYRAILDAGLANQRAGGQGNNSTPNCIPPGMPRAMIVYEPMEIVVTPETTYIMIEFMHQLRRIYTDGHDWPQALEPSFAGYSIGKWEDEDGDDRYDTLVIETRGIKGPRTFDGAVPLHKDNQTIVKERIYLDKADPNILRDEITTIDNALTRPWTITRAYRRARGGPWVEHSCAENNDYVFIEGQTYHLGIDGKLAPSRKDQPPPDLRHFEQSRR